MPILLPPHVLRAVTDEVRVLLGILGRGRVQANEYRVKLDLLRDSALYGRSDEALVRIVVPIQSAEAEAFEVAGQIAGEVIPSVQRVLPGL